LPTFRTRTPPARASRVPPSGRSALGLLTVLLFLLLPEALAPGQAVPGPDVANGDYPGYWSWEQIVEQIETYEREHPGLVRVESIGRTYEGRDILAVKVSADVEMDDPAKPEILFMAGIHPREQPPQVALMRFMDELVTGYGHDERVTRLVDTRAIWFIPVYNVDGKVYDFANGNGSTQGANWRVTRRPFGDGRYGVDLNRNGVVGWGSASDAPGSATYHGPGPISEPESQALFDFLESRRFRIFLDIHSSLEAYLLPGHLIREEAERFLHLTEGMKRRQREPYGGSPRMGETESRANTGTGAGQTHVTGFYVHGAYSIVFEIGPAGTPARFYPTAEEILDHYERNVRETWYFLLEEAGTLPARREGQALLAGHTLSGPLVPGARVELLPDVRGTVAYGVLVSRDPAVRVTGEYRLHPMTRGGHILNVAEDAVPGTEIALQLYLWDRDRRRTVIDLSLPVDALVAAEDEQAAVGAGSDGGG
jgi:hypothetical protein